MMVHVKKHALLPFEAGGDLSGHIDGYTATQAKELKRRKRITVFAVDGFAQNTTTNKIKKAVNRVVNCVAWKISEEKTELKTIIVGIFEAIRTTIFVIILLMLFTYIYCVCGCQFFAANDPVHFGSLRRSLATMMRCLVLDRWTQVFYINYYGCQLFTGEYYYGVGTNVDTPDTPHYLTSECKQPRPAPLLATLFFFSYIVLATICITALVIGSVGLVMFDSHYELSRHAEELKKKREALIGARLYRQAKNRSREKLLTLRWLKQACKGYSLTRPHTVWDFSTLKLALRSMSDVADVILRLKLTRRIILVSVVAAGALAGVETSPKAIEFFGVATIYAINVLVLIIFLVEVLLRISLEMWNLKAYFNDNWNKIDFTITVLATAAEVFPSLIPASAGSVIVMFRMFRLLRVIKLFNAVEGLQNMVDAVVNSLASVRSCAIILFGYLITMGALGMALFGKNDPVRFGSLSRGFMSMMQCMTFDEWSAIVFAQMYGCETSALYLEDYPDECRHSQPNYWGAFFFFSFDMCIGSMMIVAIFIGVMSYFLDDGYRYRENGANCEAEVARVVKYHGVSKTQLSRYRAVFAIMDFTQSNYLTDTVLDHAISYSINTNYEAEDMRRWWHQLKVDHLDVLPDFGLVLKFFLKIKDEREERKMGIFTNAFNHVEITSDHDGHSSENSHDEDIWCDVGLRDPGLKKINVKDIWDVVSSDSDNSWIGLDDHFNTTRDVESNESQGIDEQPKRELSRSHHGLRLLGRCESKDSDSSTDGFALVAETIQSLDNEIELAQRLMSSQSEEVLFESGFVAAADVVDSSSPELTRQGSSSSSSSSSSGNGWGEERPSVCRQNMSFSDDVQSAPISSVFNRPGFSEPGSGKKKGKGTKGLRLLPKKLTHPDRAEGYHESGDNMEKKLAKIRNEIKMTAEAREELVEVMKTKLVGLPPKHSHDHTRRKLRKESSIEVDYSFDYDLASLSHDSGL
jgi:voltage-gated sodium channel